MSQASIVSMWRYPVKSMMGEELNACDITLRGLFGDRAYAVIDTSTGKLANAKNPLKWPRMFEFRANYVEPCLPARALPAVRVTLPDGATGVSGEAGIDGRLTASFDRPVRLITPASHDVQFEGYVPDLEGLAGRNEVFTGTSPSGTFFDIGMVHLLTTATIDRLRALLPQSRIEVRRFRPNLILDLPGEEGFVENTWMGRTLRIGSQVRLQIVKSTIRCVMTTLPQGDLPRDNRILRGAVQNNGGAVGVYANVLEGGHVQRGDRVEFEP